MPVALFGKKKEKIGGAVKTYEKVATDGFQAMRSGDEEKAILSFRKLLRWVTEDADKIARFSKDDKVKLSQILTDAGEAMIRMKEYDSAIKLLEKAKTIDPTNFRAWMDIGRDLIQRNTQIPYALVCLREGVKLQPNNVEVHLLLGDAYRTQGQDDKAIKEYQEVLQINPENEDAVEKMLKLQPENIDLLEKYIKILEKKGNKEDLIKAYTKMAAITGNNDYLEKGLKLDPNNKNLLMHKVRILIKSNNMEEARRIVDGLIKKYPDDPDVEMLAEELKPEEEVEEIKTMGVEEVFGDIGFEEIPVEGLEEKIEEKMVSEKVEAAPMKVEAKEEVPQPTEITEAESLPIEEEKVAEEIPPIEEAKPEIAPMIEEKRPEITTEEAKPEIKEKKEITPVEMFKNEIRAGNEEKAKSMLGEMSDDDIHLLINENEETIKLILDFLEKKEKYDLAIEFATKLVEINSSDNNILRKSRILIELGKVDEAERELNELVKKNIKNMKNGYLLYEKAKIMAIRGNEMGTRNFLMMAIRFAPELKSKLKDEKYFEAYRNKDWFQKMQL